MEATLRAGIRKKLFIKMNPRLLALGLEGLSNAYLVELIERPGDISEGEIVEAIKRILCERVFLNSDAG